MQIERIVAERPPAAADIADHEIDFIARTSAHIGQRLPNAAVASSALMPNTSGVWLESVVVNGEGGNCPARTGVCAMVRATTEAKTTSFMRKYLLDLPFKASRKPIWEDQLFVGFANRCGIGVVG